MTSLGCLRQAHLTYLECKYITAFASISSNRNRGAFEELLPSKWYRRGRKNPVSCRKPRFRGRRVSKQAKVVQISMTKADLFLRIFEAIPGTLKRFELYPLECGNTLETP